MFWQKFRRRLYFISFIIIFSCSDSKNKNAISANPLPDTINKTSSSTQKMESNNQVNNTSDSALVNNFEQIFGKWSALEGAEDLTIIISKDSFYYSEHAESHKYELNKDSIFIHYPEYTITGKPWLLYDTFAIVSENQTTKFLRTKN